MEAKIGIMQLQTKKWWKLWVVIRTRRQSMALPAFGFQSSDLKNYEHSKTPVCDSMPLEE